MESDIKNNSGKLIVANYNYNGTELTVLIDANENPNIHVLSYYIDGSRQEIEDTDFYSFQEMCKYFGINECDIINWVGNHTLDGTEPNFKLFNKDKLEYLAYNIVEVDNEDESFEIDEAEISIDSGDNTNTEDITQEDDNTENIEVITEDLGAGMHRTEIPPLNLSDDTIEKQANYTADAFKYGIEIKIKEDTPEIIKGNHFVSCKDIEENISDIIIFKKEAVDKIVDAIAHNFCITLSGPTGLGKSYLISQILSQIDKSVVYRTVANNDFCNKKLTLEQRAVGGKVVTFEGPVAEGLRRTNEDTRFFIWVDESNHCMMHDAMGSLWEWCNTSSSKIDALGNGEMMDRPDNLRFIFTENPVELVTESASLASIRRFHRISLTVDDIDIEELKKVSKCPNIVNRWVELNNIITRDKDTNTYNQLAALQIGPCNILGNLRENEIESYEAFKIVVNEYITFIADMLAKFDVNIDAILKKLNEDLVISESVDSAEEEDDF